MAAANPFKLVVFDVDGTLVRTHNGKPYRTAPDDWVLLPGRRERIRALLKAGVHVAIATNQGGVAFGIQDETEMRQAMERTVEALAGEDAGSVLISIAFSHPKGKIAAYTYESDMRKPGGGMIRRAMEHFDVPADQTLMVGDRKMDRAAAGAAGVQFQWAGDYFRELTSPEASANGREVA